MSTEFELTVRRTIPAPRKDIFEAWLSAEALAQFMKPMPNVTIPTAEVDGREGGKFLIVMRVGEKDLPHRGEYKTIQRYDRLSFSWLSEFSVPQSLVTLDFEEIGPRGTEVTLHHVGFANEESRNNHEGGWGKILQSLQEHFRE